MFDPCKLTIGSRLLHEGNYSKVIALEEKELTDGTTEIEITVKYLDNTKTVKGYSDTFTAPGEKEVRKKRK